ncbi:hypothetical protein MTBPR1_140023 [Candidatus Terasakiella magnetica]|uniref:Uncharacterized protein n=1 Tax=Candidatus Terasakiella magnetica TaxID=1867952 RepID=A0A1C3RF72_9PROT|nr:hypothetical protein MTBPR1_140023 [Candidatus Terasakiella magnetica]
MTSSVWKLKRNQNLADTPSVNTQRLIDPLNKLRNHHTETGNAYILVLLRSTHFDVGFFFCLTIPSFQF